MSTSQIILQLSPNDHPPFADICAVYKAAGESLGCRVVTIFFSSSIAGEGVSWAEYLNSDDLSRLRPLVRSLEDRVAELDISDPILAICHRYRTYRALRASAICPGRMVALAHEFGFFKRVQRRVERKLFAREFLFAGVSPAVQANLGQTVSRPLCLANGIDQAALKQMQLSRDAALVQLGCEPGPFTVGVMGRLIPWKRPQLAVRAIADLAQRIPDVRLLILGEGELRGELEELAHGLPVEIVGFVPDAKRLMRALDVLLMVSEDREAFGMVALEAMASGVPVLAGQARGPESVLGGVGFYYDKPQPDVIADALQEIHELYQSGGIGARVQQGIERTTREFSVAAVARRLDDLFFQTG